MSAPENVGVAWLAAQAHGTLDNPGMSKVGWALAGSAVDALSIGLGGALLYWALWGGSAWALVSFGVVAGLLTASLMRLENVVRHRKATAGDLIISRLRR